MRKQKIRRDFKIAKIIALSLVILLSVSSVCYLQFGKYFDTGTIVVSNNLNNSFSYDYEINTKENEFVDYSEQKDYTAYVTDLIENLDLNFKYKFEDTSGKKSDITYKYSISGKLYGYYTKNSEEQKIIEKDYEIIPEKTNSLNGASFGIDEKFQVDLQPYNELINNFKIQQDMQISSTYDVILNVEVEGASDEPINYSSGISIEVGSKTTKIVGENNKLETITVDTTEKIDLGENNTWIIVVLSVIAGIAIIRLFILIFFTEELAVIRNVYKAEVNEIIRSCQDKIVVVNNLPDFENKHDIKVDNIDELIKLSEELYKPILCYENDEETVTQFIVMSEETVYKIIINKNK